MFARDAPWFSVRLEVDAADAEGIVNCLPEVASGATGAVDVI